MGGGPLSGGGGGRDRKRGNPMEPSPHLRGTHQLNQLRAALGKGDASATVEVGAVTLLAEPLDGGRVRLTVTSHGGRSRALDYFAAELFGAGDFETEESTTTKGVYVGALKP